MASKDRALESMGSMVRELQGNVRELEAQLKSVMADNQRMCHEKSDILEQHDLAMYNSER